MKQDFANSGAHNCDCECKKSKLRTRSIDIAKRRKQPLRHHSKYIFGFDESDVEDDTQDL